MFAVAIEMFSRLLISATSYFIKIFSKIVNQGRTTQYTVRGSTRKSPSTHTTNRNLLPFLRGSFSHKHFLSTSFVRALPCSLSRIRKTSSSWLRDGSLGMHAEIKGTRSHDVFVRNSVQARSINLGAELCQLGVSSPYFFLHFFCLNQISFVRQLVAAPAGVNFRVDDCSPLRLHEQNFPSFVPAQCPLQKRRNEPPTFTCPKRPANFGQRSLFHEI